MDDVVLALQRWQAGQQRALCLAQEDQQRIEPVLIDLVAELRRRIGGRFQLLELVKLYDQGTDWCLAHVVEKIPEYPSLWDPALTADPAFALYAKEASDFAGGRYGPIKHAD